MDYRQELQTGTVLDGKYRIERVIGAGGFGITYEAFDLGLANSVAIKEYYPSQFGTRDASMSVRPRSYSDRELFDRLRSSFLREGRTLARFDNPSIVRVLSVFEGHGTAYMVMKYETGPSLKIWLANLDRYPTQDELDRLTAPLLDALETMHKADFLHRDIAPDNIIIRADGSPVLLDFGASRRVMGAMSGTLTGVVKKGFSPQEQYASDGRSQGPWTDIYSLGATLYRAVTGHMPPEAPERMLEDNMRPTSEMAQGAYRPAFLEGIDVALRVWPKQRPQTISEWRPILFRGTYLETYDSGAGWSPGARGPSSQDPGSQVRAPFAPATGPRSAPGPASQPPSGPPQGAFGPPSAPRRSEPSQPPPPQPQPAPQVQPARPPEPIRFEAPQAGADVVPPRRSANRIVAAGAAGVIAAMALFFGLQFSGIIGPEAEVKRIERERKAAADKAVRDKSVADAAAAEKAVRDKAAADKAAADKAAADKAARDKAAADKAARDRAAAEKAARERAEREAAEKAARDKAAADREAAEKAARERLPRRLAFAEQAGGSGASLYPVSVAFGERLILAGGAGGTLRLWSATDGQPRTINGLHREFVSALALAPDGARFVSGSWDGEFRIWDSQSGQRLGAFTDQRSWIAALRYTGASNVVAVHASGLSRVIDAGSGRVLSQSTFQPQAQITSAAVSHDGAVVAAGTGNNAIEVWEQRSGRLQRRLSDGHSDWVLSLAFAPDSQHLASGGLDGRVIVWALSDGRQRHVLQGHSSAVRAVAYAPGNARLATGSDDGAILVWNTDSGARLLNLSGHGNTVRGLAFNGDGTRLISASEDGDVRVWYLEGQR
jgi:serine/threonine protein kinase